MTDPSQTAPGPSRAGRFRTVFLKFAASSMTASVIDLGLFTLGCELLRNSGLAWYTVLCTVVARIASAAYNYLINYRLVFRSHADHRRENYKLTHGLRAPEHCAHLLFIVLCLCHDREHDRLHRGIEIQRHSR